MVLNNVNRDHVQGLGRCEQYILREPEDWDGGDGRLLRSLSQNLFQYTENKIKWKL